MLIVEICANIEVDALVIAKAVLKQQKKPNNTNYLLEDWLEEELKISGTGFGPEGLHESQYNLTFSEKLRVELVTELLEENIISNEEFEKYLKDWDLKKKTTKASLIPFGAWNDAISKL